MTTEGSISSTAMGSAAGVPELTRLLGVSIEPSHGFRSNADLNSFTGGLRFLLKYHKYYQN